MVYVYLFLSVHACVRVVSEWVTTSPTYALGAHRSPEYIDTLSRVCKCVPKRGTAAACPCAGLMKKIIHVILMQWMKNLSLFFLPPHLSRLPSAG